MRFQVPQFIDVEDKIFGPFTVKQFVYLAGGAGLSYLVYKFVPLFIAIIIITPMMVLAVSLAFVKVGRRPFVFTLEAAFKYLLRNKMFVWKKTEGVKGLPSSSGNVQSTSNEQVVANISGKRLSDLSWQLDSAGGNTKRQ